MRTTTQQQLVSLERELALRVKVYARKVAEGSMDLPTAQHEIACTEDLWLRLRATAEGEADAPLALVDLIGAAEHPWSARFAAALPKDLRQQLNPALL